MSVTAIEYKINNASASDVHRHLSNCNQNFEPPLDKKVNILDYSKKIAEQSTTFEAWAGNNLVGLVAAYLNDTQSGKGFITNVSTLKEYLGNGIASKLVGNCLEYANENDFSEMGLEVNANNQKAIKLYEKFNFIQTDLNLENIVMRCNLK